MTLTGPAIKQNGLAVSYVYFLSKILLILVHTELIFCFQILENCFRGQIYACDTKHIDRYTISVYYKHA
jgi:hypothetical protein